MLSWTTEVLGSIFQAEGEIERQMHQAFLDNEGE